MALTGRSRKQLRDDTIAVLKAASTDAGNSVFAGRTTGYAENALPAISLYLDAETGARRDVGRPSFWLRRMRMTIACEVSGSTDTAVDDACDQLIDQVLSALVGSADWLDDNSIEQVSGYTVEKEAQQQAKRIWVGLITLDIQAQMGIYS